MKFKKKTKILSLFIVVTFVLILVNIDSIRGQLRKNLPNSVKIFVKKFIFGDEYLTEIAKLKDSNYNVLLLPQTQFLKLNFKKLNINELEYSALNHYQILKNIKISNKKKFFIEDYDKNLLLTGSTGIFGILSKKDLHSLDEEYQIKILKSNIKQFNINDIKDTLITNNKFFVSASELNIKEKCYKLVILTSKLENNFKFKKIFSTSECIQNVIAGKMAGFNFENNKGILFSTGDDDNEEKSLAQNKNSLFGKTIFLNLSNNKFEVFSSGHRNPQGLILNNDGKIISTEHGPYGGDEINHIKKGKNYGWPISSYGERYEYKENYKNEFYYKKNHYLNSFQEPIFSFVPSIGISQIIQVPDNFHPKWKGNYLVSSLQSKSLYRVKFDKNLTKIIFSEKIFIGERIRDIIYDDSNRTFLLALENSGSVGILGN